MYVGKEGGLPGGGVVEQSILDTSNVFMSQVKVNKFWSCNPALTLCVLPSREQEEHTLGVNILLEAEKEERKYFSEQSTSLISFMSFSPFLCSYMLFLMELTLITEEWIFFDRICAVQVGSEATEEETEQKRASPSRTQSASSHAERNRRRWQRIRRI